MPDYRDSLLSSYDYELSNELIAQQPINPRHDARLLVVPSIDQKLNAIKNLKVWNLQDELRSGDLLVMNDTRVLKARLRVRRSCGGSAELLLLEPLGDGIWLCLARPAKRMKIGDSLLLETIEQEPLLLKVMGIDSSTGARLIKFPSIYSDRESIEVFLDRYGEVPLPPYIHRHDPNNQERYQTRYALRPGAVAAPTAGLHISDELLDAFSNKGIKQVKVTLHVGLGTFRPVSQEDLNDLKLHSEWVEIREEVLEAINACRARKGRVIAIGTTSLRALEGAFSAMGGKLKPYKGLVDLVIKPGYKFGVVDGLLTNFHLPKSSLLLLVSALIGREKLLAIYSEAIKRQYRFFSYGDAMWISPDAVPSEFKLN